MKGVTYDMNNYIVLHAILDDTNIHLVEVVASKYYNNCLVDNYGSLIYTEELQYKPYYPKYLQINLLKQAPTIQMVAKELYDFIKDYDIMGKDCDKIIKCIEDTLHIKLKNKCVTI